MTNLLIAYIPVLNQQYVDWLKRHQPFKLFLISQQTAELLIPRLARNLGALSVSEITPMIRSMGMKGDVYVLDPPKIPFGTKFVMPDEDVCHAVAEEYLRPDPLYLAISFEQIWARWDMTAVKRQEPVIPDLEVSSEKIDQLRMEAVRKLAKDSPDWWRQIGAMAFWNGRMIACSYNAHHPTEYETMLFGDPRINFNAGESAGAEVYLSLHAEKGLVGVCAREGIPLKGASVYVATFPCGDCARMLAECRIKELFFSEGYSALKGFETLKVAGVRIVKIKDPESA